MAKKQGDTDSGGSESDTQFVVEVIKAARLRDRRWEYLVKWANYDSSEDSWEPLENLNCPRLYESFWDDVGTDDDDYYDGYEVQATPSWIKREKKYFAKSVGQKKEDMSEGDESEPIPAMKVERPVIKNKGRYKGKGKAVTKPRLQQQAKPPKSRTKHKHKQDASEDSDIPLSASVRKGKRRARVAIDSSDEADDDDDKPLAKSRQTKLTVKIPASTSKPEPKPKSTPPQRDPDQSDSAGSLFSDKDPSSPELALKGLPSTVQSTTNKPAIPMKRQSTSDGPPGHRKRQIKEMPMPITATAGNATKARLAQRVPPNAGPSSASETRPTTQKLDLSNLSFKKNMNTATTASTPVVANSPSVPSSSTILPLPRRSASVSDHAQSPAPGGRGTPTFETPAGAAPTLQELRRTLLLPRRNLSVPKPTTANDTMGEAETFLSAIMPPSLVSPMQEDAAIDMPPPPPVRPGSSTMLSLPRLQKKWRWTGDIFMDVSRDRAESVCQVVFSDATDALPNGLRFSICLSGDSIRFSAFHDMASLPMFLLASSRVQQFAKVGPLADKDKDILNQLGAFMKKQSYFCYAHLYMDEVSVALLIIYPTGHPTSAWILKVPSILSVECALQVALIPWELTTKEFHAATWKSRSPTVEGLLDPAFIPVFDAEGRGVLASRRFYQALHILGFPKTLYDFMPNRSYCIWNFPSDNTQLSVGYETSLLKAILSKCKGKNVGHKEDVRVIFVHVGSLATLQNLPALVERRMKQPELRFITYGTHPAISRERWGMRELYPLGGIVTFTPSAIIEGHCMLFERIKQIAEHPMWECYVLPSVVAMVAKLTCQGMHPLRVYDEGDFVYNELLVAIERGDLALLQAPKLTPGTSPTCDPAQQWTRWMFRLPTMNARQILEECLKLAAEQFANTEEADLPTALDREISRDLLRMQLQPAIADKYRRFVVMRSKNDIGFANDKNGIECTTASSFDFRDDYFVGHGRRRGTMTETAMS